jgi:hypothetical protein
MSGAAAVDSGISAGQYERRITLTPAHASAAAADASVGHLSTTSARPSSGGNATTVA